MKTIAKGMVSAVALVAFCGLAHAASQQVLGKKLIVKNPTGVNSGRTVIGLGKENPSSATVVGNPMSAGATLEVIANGTTSSDQTFTLPAGSWHALGSIGYKYLDTDGPGAVKLVIIKKTPSGVFLLKILLKGLLGPLNVVPPNTGTDGGFILDISGGDSYCVDLGGAAGGMIKVNTGSTFKVINATSGACPSPPSTTTTSSTIATTSTTSTSTSSTSTTSTTCPAPGAFARVISTPGDLVDGPQSRGKMGDILLTNDKIQVVIQQPGRVMFGIGTYGGNIIDADLQRCGAPEHDNFEEWAPGINIENTADYTNVTILNDGTNSLPAVVEATGPDDLLDFVNPSSVVAGFGFAFPVSADDMDLPVDVKTDYTLQAGKSYLQVDTTVTNQDLVNPLSIYFNDYLNGSGQIATFQPGYGFGEPLVTQPCPGGGVGQPNFPSCTAGKCDPCDFVAFPGVDDAAGIVSYGYIHPFNGSTTFTTDGVTVPLLGVRAALVLIGTQPPNFTISAGGSMTFTRYFAVGDGTVGAIAGIRNDILGVSNGTLSGTVSDANGPVGGAEVVAIVTPGTKGPGTTNPVFDHFRTAPDGTYSGTVPPGTYNVRVNKDGRLVGAPDPAPVTIIAAMTTTQNFTLPLPGSLHVQVTDESSNPIPAKVQLVGFDPNPDPLSTQTVLGTVFNVTGVFEDIGENQAGKGVFHVDETAYGIALGTFADRTGSTPTVEIEPGTYQLVVSHGPRYSASKQTVTINPGVTTSVAVQIAKVISTPNAITADFHVHAQDSPDCQVSKADRVRTMLAEGMDLFTPSDHDFRADFNPTIASMGVSDLIAVAQSAEITTFDYGHFNSWPQPHDSSVNGGGVDWGRAGILPGMDFPSLGSYGLSPGEIFTAAHATSGALIQINHMNSFFSKSGLTIDTAEAGTGPPQSHTPPATRRLNTGIGNFWDAGFDALEVWIGTDGRSGEIDTFIGKNIGDWFNLLNQGFLATGIADSDTHHRRSTQMNARNYVSSAETNPANLGTLTEAQTLAANIVAGKTIGTNAPFVTITAHAVSTNDDAGLGVSDSTLLTTTDGAVDVTVSVKSPLWAEFDTIQLYVNNAPQAFDDDADLATPNRYRVIPDYTQSPTVTTVNDFPLIPDAKHLEATVTFNLTGLTQDSWIVAIARGTDGVSHPLFPVEPNSLQESTNLTLGDLTDGNLNQDGMPALAFTNPLYVDVNGGGWTPPGVMLTP